MVVCADFPEMDMAILLPTEIQNWGKHWMSIKRQQIMSETSMSMTET